MSRGLSRADVAQLAATLQRLLDRIRAGELDGSAATIYRMEGAVVALLTTLGERPDDLMEELLRTSG